MNTPISSTLVRLVLVSGGLFVTTAAAWGQVGGSPFLNQQREIEDTVRARLDRDLPADRAFDLEYGGWYGFYLFQWDDGIESDRLYMQHDTRLWAGLTIDQGAHEFYARGRWLCTDLQSETFFDSDINDGVELDRGYYQFDLKQAALAYADDELDWNLRVKIGRDLVEFGTGYALSMRMDHLKLTLNVDDIELQGLMGSSVPDTPDIDRSRPLPNDSDRNFWGMQVRYQGWEHHEPFFYAYYNNDMYHEARPILNQDWDYDSFYAGIGSNGALFVDNLRYGTELVFEAGRTYGDRDTRRRDRIHAWAYDFLVEYLSQSRMKPRVGFEYMFAMGDGDRTFSPTNTVGGNTRGLDTSFVGFGYRDTGLSFAPRLSNIHVFRTGASFLPFEQNGALDGLELGTNWFLYAKNQSSGAVSDGTANLPRGYLGWEMDYFANWRVTSDLSCTMRFGTFFPGDAFSDRGTRTFFLVGTTWSF